MAVLFIMEESATSVLDLENIVQQMETLCLKVQWEMYIQMYFKVSFKFFSNKIQSESVIQRKMSGLCQDHVRGLVKAMLGSCQGQSQEHIRFI